MKQYDYDLVIVGGGMVGASLAYALQHTSLKIALIEAYAPQASDHPSYDSRAIALSYGSKEILNTLGVWQRMVEDTVTPITNIHVSDRGHFGATRISAENESVDALGYVVEAGVMGRAMNPGLAEMANLTMLCPAKVINIATHQHIAELTVEQGDNIETVTTRLVVASDGGNSSIARLLNARTWNGRYDQTAIIANVTTDQPNNGYAFERFTESGPMAMLPNRAPAWMDGHEDGDYRWSLVWTVHDHQVDEIMALNDDEFIARMQARFGKRAGRVLSVTPRSAYPLRLQFIREFAQPRVAFIGNAAHIIHPVAGQGYNLGLRDAAALAEVISAAAEHGEDPGTLTVMKHYQRWRKGDYLRVAGMTNSMVKLFSTDNTLAVIARDIGMVLLDLFPPARRLLTHQTLGILGKQTKLARGVPLGGDRQ